ncbi:MAG: HNH endonuclease [Bacteroidetes bacterium]|nr:HNH endonuclease [Bacteroidota bacterium]
MGLFNQIPGYEGYYEIDRTGNVRSIKRVIKTENCIRTINSKSIRPRCNNSGYLEIRLSKNGKTKTKFIHRLLAMTYIKNTDNKPEVNHINGVKMDNRLDNLEWVTKSEKYATCI